MAVNSFMVPIGTQAPRFALCSLDGQTVSSDGAYGRPMLVMFLSNHCPYVRHIECELSKLVSDYANTVASLAICSNDIDNYPDDGPAGLAEQSRRAGFSFPYLLDESQQVALAFRAACTPDFFLYNADHKLAYRGQFDESRPRNDIAVTGDTLRTALDHVAAGQPVAEPHQPSLGCGIKWKPGNEPS